MKTLTNIFLFLLIFAITNVRAYSQIDMKVDIFEDFFVLTKTKSYKLDTLISVNSGTILLDKLSNMPSVYGYLNAYNYREVSIRGLSSKRNNYFFSEIELNSPYNGTVPQEILGLGSIQKSYLDFNSTNQNSFSNVGSEINLLHAKTHKIFDFKSVIQGGNSNGFGLVNAGGNVGEFFWNTGVVFNSRPDYPISKDNEHERYTLNNSLSTSTAALLNLGFENQNSQLSLLMLLFNNSRDLPYDYIGEQYAQIPKDNRLYSKLNYKTYLLSDVFMNGNIFFNTEDKQLHFYYDKERQFLVQELYGVQNVKTYSYGFDSDFIFFNDYIPPIYAELKYRKDVIDVMNKIDFDKSKNEAERLQLVFKQNYWIKDNINFIYNIGLLINNPMRISTKRAVDKTNHILYNFGITLDLMDNLDLNLALGRSLRLPYINEYSSVFSDSLSVLLELEPEVKNYYEIGLKYNSNYTGVAVNFFSNSIQNYIYPFYTSLKQNIYVNNGEVNLQGAEAELNLQYKYFDIICSYSLLIENLSLESNYKEVIDIFIPKDMLKTSLTIRPLARLSLNYSFKYYMNFANQNNLQVHDAFLDLKIIDNMQGKFSVKNILDKEILGVFDLPLIGREFSIGAYIFL